MLKATNETQVSRAACFHRRALSLLLLLLRWLDWGWTAALESAWRVGRVLLLDRSRYLQRRLGRCFDQASAIHGRIIDELPLIVVIFVIEFANALSFAGTGHAHDRSPAENLAGQLVL